MSGVSRRGLKSLSVAVVALLGIGLGGLELFAGVSMIRVSLHMPTTIGSGGIGAVSAGCAEALLELGFTALSTMFVVAAARRGGSRARTLARVYGIVLIPMLVVLYSGIFRFTPRLQSMLFATQLLVMGVATLWASWDITRTRTAGE